MKTTETALDVLMNGTLVPDVQIETTESNDINYRLFTFKMNNKDFLNAGIGKTKNDVLRDFTNSFGMIFALLAKGGDLTNETVENFFAHTYNQTVDECFKNYVRSILNSNSIMSERLTRMYME